MGIGLAKGKKQHDRRESFKAHEASREVERAMKENDHKSASQ